jgi:hypothetical protein
MIVGQSLPAIAPRTQGGNAQQELADAERPALSFAELLLGSDPALATASAEFDFASSGRDFRGTVNVGEDAIRFDARPVVAPAQLAGPDELVHDAVSGAAPGHPGTSPAINDPAAGAPVRVLQALSPAFHGSGPFQQGLRAADASAPTGRERPGKGTAPGLAASPAHRARASGIATPAADGPPEATFAARAAAAAAQAKPPVSMVVSPQDVLVVVHGITLSAAELKTLLQDVRDLLASHGFGDRAIRLRTDSRRAR